MVKNLYTKPRNLDEAAAVGDVELLTDYRLGRSEEIIGDISYALKRLGGSAHICVLTQTVQAKRRLDNGGPVRDMTSDIDIALHAHDLDNKDRVKTALFRRPFGVDSRRWSLHDPGPRAAGFPSARHAAE